MHSNIGTRLKSVIGVSLKFRFMVIAAAVALFIVGVAKMGNTPTNLIPEFSGAVVEIQTEALGLSAAEVEQLISVPLEADLLNGLAWLESIRSESIPSLSTVYLTFEPGTNVMAARQMVQEKLTQAGGLPNVSKPPVMLQPVSSASRVLQVGLKSKDVSLIQMSVLARWNIRPRLMGVPGVANVSIWGLRNRQLQVLVNPERIRSNGVTLHDIVSTTGNALWVSPLSFLEASSPGTGGVIDGPNQRLGVRHVLPIVSPEGLANVVVEGSNKRLGDVAQVVESHQPLIGDAIVGNETGLMLVVEKFPWANTLEVTRNVEKALASLRPGLKGIEMDTNIFRPASFIERSVDNLKLAAIASGVLILIGLFFYFLDLRVALISAAAIGTSLLLAWFVLYVRGVTVDALVFMGLAIAIGAIVDDAIVDVQNIRRRLAQAHPQGATTWNIITEASAQIRGPMVFVTLMLLLLALPFFFFEGVVGSFLSATAASYGIALIASLVVAMTLTPALSLLLLKPPRDQQPSEVRGSPLSRALVNRCAGLASNCSRAIIPAYVISAVALVAVVLAVTTVTYPALHSKAALPKFHETDFLIRWDAKAGTSLPEMSRITKQVSIELKQVPGVRSVGGHVGRATTSDQVVGANSGELWISLDTKADYHGSLRAIDKVLRGYPGVEYDTSTYAEERIEKASGTDEDKVVVRVYGQDSTVLAAEGQKIVGVMAGVKGAREIEVPRPLLEPTIEIRVDLARAQQYGIKPGDVRRGAATLLSGIEVGSLFEEKKVFDVIVWGVPEIRSSVSDVRNLLLQSPSGSYLRLSEVADVRVTSQPAVIKRESVARYVDVDIDVDPGMARAVAEQVSERLKGHAFPTEYHAEVLRNNTPYGDPHRGTLSALLLSVIGIFLLLQAALRSWRLAAIVTVTVPVALLGGIALILATGAEYNLGAFVGLVAVAGLALRAATLLITHFQHLERVEGVAFGPVLIARGTVERALPLLASAIVVALALLPFLLYRNDAGLEIVGPMAGVVLAGMFTTLLFALFVLPTLYLALGEGAAAEEDFEELQERALYV